MRATLASSHLPVSLLAHHHFQPPRHNPRAAVFNCRYHASLIVDLGLNPLRQHTWSGITDSGYFTNHDRRADTLYGADVCTHPDCRGLGVGAALYEARRELCRKFNLRRILLGGRLWNYDEHADRFGPHEYAARVVAGEIRDLVLRA